MGKWGKMRKRGKWGILGKWEKHEKMEKIHGKIGVNWEKWGKKIN